MRLQGADKGLLRAAPLPAAGNAFLNIGYRRKDFADETDWITVEASTDGGATWTTLSQLSGPATDAGVEFASYPLADASGPKLWVRFVTASTMTDQARFYLDLVDITLPTPVDNETPTDPTPPAESGVLTTTTTATNTATNIGAKQIYLPLITGDATTTPGDGTANPVETVTAACAACINTANLLSIAPQTIGATQLWNTAPYLQGNGVTVAVVDSGIAPHVDFKNADGSSRILARASFAAGSSTLLDDFYGHGTHVAGIIGANGAQSGGAYMGIAPKVNLVDVKVTNDFGAGTTAEVVAGLQWVHENRTRYNIRIVNLSLNSSVAESYHQSALNAALEILWFNGIVVVVSAGNSGLSALYPPANDPFVITVGATNPRGTPTSADDNVASFSAYGVAEDGSIKPDLLAPGQDLVSLLSSDDSNLARTFVTALLSTPWGTRYFKMSGTSAASAVAAGAAALLLQDEPGLTPDQVKFRLINTARPLATGQCGAARYLNIEAAVNGARTASANTGVQASQMLWSGSQPVTWNSVSWNSVSWNSVSWNSVSWNSVSWNSVSWNSAGWNVDGSVDPCRALGLAATYYNNTSFSGVPVLQRSEAINADWGNGSPGSGVNSDNFSASWHGRLAVPTSGAYQFQTLSDDGVRFWLNGQLLIDNWTEHPPTTDTSGVINLTAGGQYDVVVAYYEQGGDATLRWLWKTPLTATFVPVPTTALFNTAVALPFGGGLASAPSCVALNGRMDCFIRSTDNALWQQTWNGSGWSGWKSLGQTLTSAPSCTVAGIYYDCFYRGSDNSLWQIFTRDGNTWSGPYNLGGSLTEAPSCVFNNGRHDCFTRGIDNALYQKTWNGTAWSGWKRLGQTLTSAPSCVLYGINFECFFRGSDNGIWRLPIPLTPTMNVALGKPVTASSWVESSPWARQNATDGIGFNERSVGWSSDSNRSVDHTEWVVVDLLSPVAISEVSLLPRQDGGNAGYGFPRDFTIAVSPDNVNWQTVVNRTGYLLPATTLQSFNFPVITARYVRVMGTSLSTIPTEGNRYRMQFAEIIVAIPFALTTNLALGRLATQSSTAFDGLAGRAVDGNTDGNYWAYSVTHTNGEANPWWQVDLGSNYRLSSARLWNRTDCCTERLANFYLFVSETDLTGRSFASLLADAGVWKYQVTGQASTVLEVPVNTVGRFVRVQLAGANTLSLAEVQIVGDRQAVGLAATYYNNTSLSDAWVLRRSEAVDADWGDGSPGGGVNSDNFSVRWEGQLEVPTSGGYQFQTQSDDGVRFWFNGQLLIDNWTNHGVTTDTSGVINLTAGSRYNVVVEYYEGGGSATMRWLWKTPGSATFVPVPAIALFN